MQWPHPSQQCWWTGHPLGNDEPNGEWLVACRIEPQDDRLVIAEIRILPWPTTEQERSWVGDLLLHCPSPGNVADHHGEIIPGRPSRVPPSTPAGGLTARAARTLTTEPAFEMARQTMGILMDYRDAGHITGRHLPASFTRATIEAPRQPGRRGRPDRFYAEIAAAYVAAVDAGSRTPIPDVTRRLADEGLHFSKDAVRDLVHDARRSPGSSDQAATRQSRWPADREGRADLGGNSR